MPLTDFQKGIARLLAKHRSSDSYLAGGAALHFEPNTLRFSNDLDYFQDSVERVASAFSVDRDLLVQHSYDVTVTMNQPGYIRAEVSHAKESTKIDWAHDSAWRFLPTVAHPDCGFILHALDLAVNKILALAGRDEPRDFLDVLSIDKNLLSLGAMCWAAPGKDPGFTPRSLMQLLQRRGKYQPEDFKRLYLAQPVDLVAQKEQWLATLEKAETRICSLPPNEVGCLYYNTQEKAFMTTLPEPKRAQSIICHYGRPGGVLPAVQPEGP